jgi:hypothetical protein
MKVEVRSLRARKARTAVVLPDGSQIVTTVYARNLAFVDEVRPDGTERRVWSRVKGPAVAYDWHHVAHRSIET